MLSTAGLWSVVLIFKIMRADLFQSHGNSKLASRQWSPGCKPFTLLRNVLRPAHISGGRDVAKKRALMFCNAYFTSQQCLPEEYCCNVLVNNRNQLQYLSGDVASQKPIPLLCNVFRPAHIYGGRDIVKKKKSSYLTCLTFITHQSFLTL